MRYKFILLLLLSGYIGCKNNETETRSLEDVHSILLDTIVQTTDIEALKSFFPKVDNTYKLDWSHLLSTHFIQEYNQELGMEVDVPVFNDTLNALNGELVTISGYYIPVDETGDESIVILSAYPYAQCFFCGQAGVESIIDVLIQKALPRLKTDDKVTFKGRLKLNKADYDYLIYILEDAEFVKK